MPTNRRRGFATFAGFLVLSVLLFAGSSIGRLDSACIPWCDGDPNIYRWMFEWTTFAVTHASNPFFTSLIGPPSGTPLYWVTSLFTPAMFSLPATMLWGSQVSYNLAVLLAVALSAWAVYLLCMEVTDRHGPSVVGGLLFLISPYMITELNHLNLLFIAPIPLFARLTIRFGRGLISLRRFWFLGGALLLAEFFTSTEVFGSMTLFLGVGVLLYLLLDPRSRKERARLLVVGLAGAYCVLTVVASPFLLQAFRYRPNLVFNLTNTSAALEDVFVPPVTTMLGLTRDATALRTSFAPNFFTRIPYNETSPNAYLPVPLLVLVWAAFRQRSRYPRALMWFFVISMLLSFGPVLRVAGGVNVPAPYAILANLPVLELMFPRRFPLYAWLALSVIVAIWVADRTSDSPGASPPWAVIAWVALCGVLIFPVVPGLSPSMKLPYTIGAGDVSIHRFGRTPEFMRSDQHLWFIRPGETVAIASSLGGGDELNWHVEAGLNFRLLEGYVGPYVPWSGPVIRQKYERGEVTSDEISSIVEFNRPPWTWPDLRTFLTDRETDWVAISTGMRGRFPALLKEGSWLPPISVGGVDLYRVSGWDHEPPAPLSPQAAEALRRGLASSREGMLTEAAGWFREVLADSPMDPTAHLELARIYLAYGDEVFAEAHLRAVLVAQPSAAIPMLELARLWTSQDRTTYAERAYMLAYLADPSVLNPEELAEVEARAGL